MLHRRHPVGDVEPVRIGPRRRGREAEVRAAVLAWPRRRGVEEPAADALAAPRCGHDEVLEPAAAAEADRLEIDVHRRETDDATVVDREEDVRVEGFGRVPEGVRRPLATVVGRTRARRREELLDQIEHRGLVLRRGRADGQHRATPRNASSVTSSTRATSASVCAADRNQLWCGWRYTPCAMHAAAKSRLRRNEPSSATNVMNGMAGGPV